MNTKATFYAVACASLVINYFTAPIAAPVIWDSVKSHTAEHLMAFASQLRPDHPSVVAAVSSSGGADEEELSSPSATPPSNTNTAKIDKTALVFPPKKLLPPPTSYTKEDRVAMNKLISTINGR